MAKRPAFQFYPSDWRKDPSLSVCSLAARGLWIEMMCIAHEAEEYGVLALNGKPMTEAQLSRMVGESPKVVKEMLVELEDAGVFSRREDGAIYSRRMVKDEHIRNVRSDAGKKGGNPNFAKDLPKQNHKQVLTPSSSSSASAKTGTNVPAASAAPPDLLDTIWKVGAQILVTSGISEATARSFLGMLCKQHGDDAVAEKVAYLTVHPSADPRSWLKGALNGTHREIRAGGTAARVDAANPARPDPEKGHLF